MNTASTTQLRWCGQELETAPEALGELRPSNDGLDAPAELARRMDTDGYLFFRGLLETDWVAEARDQVLESLESAGMLDQHHHRSAGIASKGAPPTFKTRGQHLTGLHRLMHTGRLRGFFERFLQEEIRSLDYVWLRVMGPGRATPPHYDIVYMGRGTTNLFTAWVPLGEVTTDCGGLMILEGSHRLQDVRDTYGQIDIDKDGNWKKLRFRHGRIFRGGHYSKNPRAVQREFGLRWLTTDYRPGDVAVFTAFTMHGSSDNQTNRFRLSADVRYQLASEPVDPRWVGENPVAHAQAE